MKKALRIKIMAAAALLVTGAACFALSRKGPPSAPAALAAVPKAPAEFFAAEDLPHPESEPAEEKSASAANYLLPVCIIKDPYHIIYNRGEYWSETGAVVEIPGLEYTGYFTRKEETANGFLYPAKKDGLWGYVSPAGEWAIPPQYIYAGDFREGSALVVLYDERPAHTNTVFAYIDPFGQELTRWSPPEMVGPFRNGAAIRYTRTDEDKTPIDIITVSGEVLASGILIDTNSLLPESVFDPSSFMENGTVCRNIYRCEALCFSQGLLPASLDGKYGFLNTKGSWVIPPSYDYARGFSEGRAVVGNGEGYYDRQYGYIGLDGELVIPLLYTEAWDFSERKAAVQLDRESAEVHFICPDGGSAFFGGYYSLLLGGLWDENEVYLFKEGLCVVYEQSPDYHGVTYIDENGQSLRGTWGLDLHDVGANGTVAYATAFRNGLAAVSDGTTQWYINRDGEKLFECCIVLTKKTGKAAERAEAAPATK